MEKLKIFTELKDIQTSYQNDKIQIIDGLYYSQLEKLRMCEFYSNSRYLKGNKDGLKRDKPFYNIVNYRVSLAKTATDLDIKDIQITSDNPKDWVRAMFLNKETYKWMKESNFSYVLNKMGQTRPKYGGYLIKKCVEYDEDSKKDELEVEVVEWKNVMTNQVCIEAGPIVETHYMSPVELKEKEDVWDNVIEVLKANKKANKGKTPEVTVYEVLGNFPVMMLKEAQGQEYSDEDEFTFTLQKYFIADVGGKSYLLYSEDKSGEEICDTYRYLAWEEMSGRALGKGVIEDSEEAQVWTNDAVINEKNAMDLAGKVVLKTNSKKIQNNILEVDNGKIFSMEDGKDLTAINLTPAALGQFQNQINKWESQANNATSSYNATTGEQPPANTPYSQTALLNQVAMKPFDYKRQEWGIHLSEMFEDWILPYVIDNLTKAHILRSDFTEDELALIDRDFALSKVNNLAIEIIASGKTVDPTSYNQELQNIINQMTKGGTKRYIEFPKDYFKDIEAKVTIQITNEQRNKSAVLQSLSTILGDVMKSYNPQTGKFAVLEDPKLSKIFGTIVEMSGAGINPIDLGINVNAQQANQASQLTQTAQPLAPTNQIA